MTQVDRHPDPVSVYRAAGAVSETSRAYGIRHLSNSYQAAGSQRPGMSDVSVRLLVASGAPSPAEAEAH